MSERYRRVRSILAGTGLAIIAACAPLVETHGYVPTDEDLSALLVGVDTRDTVEDVVGRPSAAGILDDSGWYYVKSEYEQRAWRAPEEVDRQVVSISFDEDGVVQNIERFGLEDGQVVALSRRVTDENIRGISFLRQLLGNLGNFRADQFLGDN